MQVWGLVLRLEVGRLGPGGWGSSGKGGEEQNRLREANLRLCSILFFFDALCVYGDICVYVYNEQESGGSCMNVKRGKSKTSLYTLSSALITP